MTPELLVHEALVQLKDILGEGRQYTTRDEKLAHTGSPADQERLIQLRLQVATAQILLKIETHLAALARPGALLG